MDEQKHLKTLIEAIRLLAADPETQIRQFPDFVHIPDELALIYYDNFLLAEQIAKAGLINEHQSSELKQLDLMLKKMSEEQKYWTLDALRTDHEWQNIRSMANDLLTSLNQPYQPFTTVHF